MIRRRIQRAAAGLGLLAVMGAAPAAKTPDSTSAARDTAVDSVHASGAALTQIAGTGTLGTSTPSELEYARTASGRCGVCHPRERTDFARGGHAREGVRCTSCHRGNDAAADEGGAHAGMIGSPARSAIAPMCGSCHSDPVRMKAYGLSVDQVALYQTSGHGRKLAEGDPDVATCIDCHGAHESLPATDARSLTHLTNVDHVCSRCHGNANTVVGRRLKKDMTAEWSASVHGPLHAGHLPGKKPGCTDCHGVHGAAPPEAGASGAVCGRCHSAVRRAFDEGAHGLALDPKVRPECVTCHGAHSIRETDAKSLVTSCVKCHRKGSREEALGADMYREYRNALASIDKAVVLVARADAIPLPTEDYHARIRDAREELEGVAMAAHAAKIEAVREAAMRARSVGDEVQESVGQKLGLVAERWLLLAAFWLFTGLLLVVLNRWRRAEKAS